MTGARSAELRALVRSEETRAPLRLMLELAFLPRVGLRVIFCSEISDKSESANSSISALESTYKLINLLDSYLPFVIDRLMLLSWPLFICQEVMLY